MWRGGATAGCRTCDQDRSRVRSPARARLRNDSGQVVHTQLPRRRHSSLVYIESLNWVPLPFTFDDQKGVAWWRNGWASDLRSREVTSSIHGRARLRNDSGQVVHTQLPRRRHCSALFCSLAVLDPSVGHTMDVLSPFIPVLCHPD